jgi:hypothetical protein
MESRERPDCIISYATYPTPPRASRPAITLGPPTALSAEELAVDCARGSWRARQAAVVEIGARRAAAAGSDTATPERQYPSGIDIHARRAAARAWRKEHLEAPIIEMSLPQRGVANARGPDRRFACRQVQLQTSETYAMYLFPRREQTHDSCAVLPVLVSNSL